MKFTEIEYQYDDHTILIGDVALDEVGRIIYDTFNVIVFIRGIDYDITKSFSQKQIECFKESFQIGIYGKYYEDLKFARDDYQEDVG